MNIFGVDSVCAEQCLSRMTDYCILSINWGMGLRTHAWERGLTTALLYFCRDGNIALGWMRFIPACGNNERHESYDLLTIRKKAPVNGSVFDIFAISIPLTGIFRTNVGTFPNLPTLPKTIPALSALLRIRSADA